VRLAVAVRALAIVVAAVLSAAGGAGCGYSLAGRGDFLPKDIVTIGIPVFLNHSTVPNLEVTLSEAVRREFAGHGRYKVVPEEGNADAVVLGTITSVQHELMSTAGRQAQRYAVIVSASVDFKHKDGHIIWSNHAVSFREEYDVSSSVLAGDVNNFFGGDQTALDRLAKNFAASIVTSIIEAF
jgi:hypothetical protein